MRTIFLAVRGTYQAGSAMRMLQSDVKKLTELQQIAIKRTEEMRQQANHWIFAGAAAITFGTMIGRSLMNIMQYSNAGRIALAQFGEKTTASMTRLSEAISPLLSLFLNVISTILELITANPVLLKVTSLILGLGTAIVIVAGVVMLMKGAIGVLFPLLGIWGPTNMIVTGTLDAVTGKTVGATIAVQGLNMSLKTIITTVSVVISAFMLLMNVASALDNILSGKGGGADVGAIIGGILGGVAGFAVGGPAGAIVGAGLGSTAGGMIGGALKPMPAYQAGTSFVRKGGYALLHGGEEIQSAREKTVASRIEREANRQIMGGSGGATSYTNITIPIENLNTKANIDDMDRKLGRTLKDAMDNKV